MEQLVGQDAEAGADLEDEVLRSDAGGLDHSLDDAALVEEVLAESLARPDAEVGEQSGPVAPRGREGRRQRGAHPATSSAPGRTRNETGARPTTSPSSSTSAGV